MNERQLSDSLRAYGALSEVEKPLLVSAILLALRDKEFTVSSLTGERDGQVILEHIGEDFTGKFSFMRNRAILNTINTGAGKTPLRIFAEILSADFSGYSGDLLSELYGGDYSYSGSDGHNLGIVLTPPHITELCCEILKLTADDVVLEPCCGTGRFLVTAMKYVKDKVHGIELQENLHTIANANVVLHGGSSNTIIFGDFFKHNFDGQNFTVGFMNPPYSQKITELEFIERLLSVLEVGGRGAVIVPVSTMIGKTKADKQRKTELLKHHTLEGVITLNKDTFYGVGTVPCIAVFTAGIPHHADMTAKFINFEDDGWEVKKHLGLVEGEHAEERKKYLLDCWEGKCSEYSTKFMVKSTVEASDEWLHSFYYYNDEIPTEADFAENVADYLTFECNMIMHGRKYLFGGGVSNAETGRQ